MEKILSNDSRREYMAFSNEYRDKAIKVLESGHYISGAEVEAFEKEWADYLGAKYCISVGNGLDALWIALQQMGIGEGDEVIVPANSFVASALAVSKCGATPVFVDNDQYYGINIDDVEQKISKRTKGVVAVHLYGMPCDMEAITDLCKKNGLRLVEDCAQSHGALYGGKKTGTFGDAGCFSFYPTKNLGAFGDGGCIVTDNFELANKCKVFRNYGSEKKYHNSMLGTNSRLDELQAGLLRIKLSHFDDIISERCRLARRYSEGIKDEHIQLPQTREGASPVWHQYVIQSGRREKLVDYLRDRKIETNIHYPIPIHLLDAYCGMGYAEGDIPICEKNSKKILSLPLFFGLTNDEQDRVIEAINEFKE